MHMVFLLCSVALVCVLSVPLQLAPKPPMMVSTPPSIPETSIAPLPASVSKLSNVAMLSNITTLKSMIQAGSFMSDMAKLDPTAINNIVLLLRQMVASNNADITRYATEEQNARDDKETKATNLGTLEGDLATLRQNLRDSEASVISDGDKVTSKVDDVTAATNLLTAATDLHLRKFNLKQSETSELTTEIDTLNEVIEKLQELATGTAYCDTATQREFEGYCYATLASSNPVGSVGTCQQGSINIPSGWEIVPDTPHILEAVIKPFSWSTQCVSVLGTSYRTLLYPPALDACNTGHTCTGRSCQVNGCNRQILIRRSARQ